MWTCVLLLLWTANSLKEVDANGDAILSIDPEVSLDSDHFTPRRASDPPALKLVDIETYCFGNLGFHQLGLCSSTYLKCKQFNQQKHYELAECPLGKIFNNTRCRPAYEVKDCFNMEANQLNDATEKLTKATNFCARNSLGTALYSVADSHSLSGKCSRQALLCRGNSEPLTISCPSDKVLDAQTLQCVSAPQECFFVFSGDFAPIRENLLRAYCAIGLPESQMGAPLTVSSDSAAADDKFVLLSPLIGVENREHGRCQNWYVACLAPTVEFVFCEDGKLFDAQRKTCRRVTAEDQCPHINACRGWEWRTVMLADCRNDFLYCNGLRPTIFQCNSKQAIFQNGECVQPEKTVDNKCVVCRLGDKKKGEKCDEFYYCKEHELTGTPHWQGYRCDLPRVFSPFTKDCVAPDQYSCPNKVDCYEGDSIVINCGDFFYCYKGKYTSGTCPHMTRWDAGQRRCVSDFTCYRFKLTNLWYEMEKKSGVVGECQSGEVRPSVDCATFQECIDGKFVTMSCHDYSLNRMKTPCSNVNSRINTYPIDTLLPRHFNPFAGQGIRQKQCADGEKIVNSADFGRYMECVNGEWWSLACPKGLFFNLKKQNCVVNESADCGEVCKLSPNSAVYLRPLYSLNDTFNAASSTNLGNGVGPAPVIPPDYRDNYVSSFDFCDIKSPKRLPHPFDCSKYRACELNNGGYYVEKRCPVGTQFHTRRLECSHDYVCESPKCVEGRREARGECGKLRRCRFGAWENVRCRNQMAVINGRCSKTVSCRHHNTSYSHGGQCTHLHTKSHFYNCKKYLLCNYGQYTEENCYNGHNFNPETGRCDPSYRCTGGYQPDCYENEVSEPTRGKFKSLAESCDRYEICVDGTFQPRRCAYGEKFDALAKRCIKGKCGGAKSGSTTGKSKKRYDSEKCTESAGVDGFRAHPTVCTKFYQCAAGVWVSKDCAPSLAFNPLLGVCDWPRNVPGC